MLEISRIIRKDNIKPPKVNIVFSYYKLNLKLIMPDMALNKSLDHNY